MTNEQMYNMLRAGKFKGHTRIMTENVKTGHRKMVEDHNMATNALPRIFESDYNGTMDFYNMMPLKTMLGGVFLFWNHLTESADNIFPPAQDTNKLTAHAGQNANTNSDPTRGTPNGIATVVDAANGTIKFVWDWTLEEGNGQISAAALTHQDFGDAGLYPDGTLTLIKQYGFEISNVSYFSQQIYGASFNETRAKRYPMSIKDNGIGVTLWISGTTFTEKLVRHPWVQPTLCEGAAINTDDNFTVISTRTATLSRTFTSGYTLIAQDDSNYYVMERDSQSATTLYVDIVSKTDMTVTSQTLTITESLARPSIATLQIYFGAISNGFIYWPSGADSTTFVKIDMTTPANSILLTSYLTSAISLYSQPIVINDGLILGRNYLINGDYVYPAPEKLTPSGHSNYYELYAKYKNSPLLYSSPIPSSGYSGRTIIFGGALVPYLATCNSLEDTISKDNSETMRCEYTVTFTEGA